MGGREMTGDVLGEPIRIRFEGRDADNHELEMSALADSLKGLARIIGVTSNFAATNKYVQHKDALAVRVVARPPESHCFEVWAWVQWAGQNSLIATIIGGLTVTLIAYVFKRAAGQREEMRHLKGALDLAIKELGTRDQAVVDRLLGTIDKMADALKPAARQAIAPLGETADTLTVDDVRHERAVVIGAAEKAAILAEEGVEVGDQRTYHVIITELDMESGSCRVYLTNEPDAPYQGKITDPAFSAPNNRYVMAMAGKTAIDVKAKPTLKEGTIKQLFISDAI
jgi:hypothetical protein